MQIMMRIHVDGNTKLKFICEWYLNGELYIRSYRNEMGVWAKVCAKQFYVHSCT